MDYIIIFCTINSPDNANKIATNLVQKKLAACINIIPHIRSVYVWDGKLQNDEEFLMLIKTRKVLFNSIKDIVAKCHPYEIPEIISIDITEGCQNYLDWIKNSCISD